jgi:ketosteroid isomerase-like protein
MILDITFNAALLALIPVAVAGASVKVISEPRSEEAQAIADEILGIEDSAMEEWRRGNPMRWVEVSAEEVTYIDPSLTAPVVGREAYARYLEPLTGKVFYDGSEYVNPRVAIFGSTAVLSYNYHSLSKDDNGLLQRTSFWNTTEVYHLFEDGWKIIHTHWSYIQHSLPDSLVMEIPIQMRKAEPLTGVAAELMRLETGAMERWRNGDPYGFLEISAPHVSYFDTGTPTRLDGFEQLKAEYDTRIGKIHYDVMELIEPRWHVHGDTVVLHYQFFSTILNRNGSVQSRTPWHCTEVFVKIEGKWRIVHTHWSFIKGQRADGGI